jgi:hypothetical protein
MRGGSRFVRVGEGPGIERGRHEGSSIGFHQAYPRLTVQDIHALIADSKGSIRLVSRVVTSPDQVGDTQ